MRDEAGAMVGVLSRNDIVARISHCTGCSCTCKSAPSVDLTLSNKFNGL